jgi:hypothetical protein
MILQDIKEFFPQAKVTVIAQQKIAEEIKHLSLVDKVIIVGDGFFNLFKCPISKIVSIKSEKFDLFVIPYYNFGAGYAHIKLLSFYSRPKMIVSVDIDGVVRQITPLGEFKKLIISIFRPIFVFLIYTFLFLIVGLLFFKRVFFKEKVRLESVNENVG